MTFIGFLLVVAFILAGWTIVESPKSKLAWAVLIIALILALPYMPFIHLPK